VNRHPRYKTEICKTFHTVGTCPYGRRCRFIHNEPNAGQSSSGALSASSSLLYLSSLASNDAAELALGSEVRCFRTVVYWVKKKLALLIW